MFTFHLDKSTRKSSKTIKFRLYMPNADFFLTSLIQKVKSLTFSAKAEKEALRQSKNPLS